LNTISRLFIPDMPLQSLQARSSRPLLRYSLTLKPTFNQRRSPGKRHLDIVSLLTEALMTQSAGKDLLKRQNSFLFSICEWHLRRADERFCILLQLYARPSPRLLRERQVNSTTRFMKARMLRIIQFMKTRMLRIIQFMKARMLRIICEGAHAQDY
jgi:hypothetical protein